MYLLSITSTRAKWTSCDFFKAASIAGWTRSVKLAANAANLLWVAGSCLIGRVRVKACVIWHSIACEQLGEPIFERNYRRSMLLRRERTETSFRSSHSKHSEPINGPRRSPKDKHLQRAEQRLRIV